MKQIIFIIALTLALGLVPLFGSTQATYAKPVVELGLTGGMALANASLYSRNWNDLEKYYNADTAFRMGYTGGLQICFRFMPKKKKVAKVMGFALDFDPNFITKGYFLPINNLYKADEGLITLSYLNLPLVLKFRFPYFLYWGVGFFTDILMSTESGLVESAISRSEISFEKDPALKMFGMGFNLHAGIQFRVGKDVILHAALIYDMGLTNIRLPEYNPLNEEINTRAFRIEGGFRLRVGEN